MKLYECTKPKTKSIVMMEYINLLLVLESALQILELLEFGQVARRFHTCLLRFAKQ